MKLVIIALTLVAAALAAPPSDAQIVRSELDQNPDGGYNFLFETDDGTKREETGEVKEVLNEENKPQQVVVVRGSYSYNDETGKPVSVTYFADETGFHAEGDTVPKA